MYLVTAILPSSPCYVHILIRTPLAIITSFSSHVPKLTPSIKRKNTQKSSHVKPNRRKKWNSILGLFN
ncbi:hypothetical protein EYC84_003485 [Monilinia fructicola]|uniref:Uncharacterized protein n=1 Tax=Monilinia fructicola TaxID=38448 RepID=A0A5M9K205_MONFR|nr:hypothetical protein EYC84_003485 [Monilinia fructicola]